MATYCKEETSCLLNNHDISRYSRQLILPELGVTGQLRLAKSRVLLIGAGGGLGCPCLQYLAAAGVGNIGLVDGDCVDISNLHRQILHGESDIGTPKVDSAVSSLNKLNSEINYYKHNLQLDRENALELVGKYDVIFDCSDNVATRYLVSDACVLTGKPLVSGSALRWEGQLTVYNHDGSPCYRCLYPEPPHPDTVTNCSEGGVVGVVPGIIGCLQALEGIKLAAGLASLYAGKLLVFDGLRFGFRTVRLRGRRFDCPVCGIHSSIQRLNDIDYTEFCGAGPNDKCRRVELLDKSERISVTEYKECLDRGDPCLLVDVREPVELELCSLPVNKNFQFSLPYSKLKRSHGYCNKLLDQCREIEQQITDSCKLKVFIVCKQGNDSQRSVRILKENPDIQKSGLVIKDIVGGLDAWSTQIDENFPRY